MNIRRILSISSIAVFVASVLVAPTFAAGNPNCTEVDGDYIVTFSKGAVVANEIKNVNGKQVNPKFMYSEALNGFAGRLTGDQVCNLKKRGNVEDIEADQIMSINTIQNNAPWGLDRIDQPGLPLSTTYTDSSTGFGVKAYVIDTGILETHNEFAGRMANGYSPISDGGGTVDCHGHGTHVAGTIGGTTYGVAERVTLVPIRVLNCQGSGSVSNIVAGINWVITDHLANQPAVANMSLGGGISKSLDIAVGNLVKDGVFVSVAAGNDFRNACNYSPARVSSAMTVAASTNSDSFAYFSNFGSCVDVIAPGDSITSAWIGSNTATNTISGTSMASPHVAGVAARLLETRATSKPSDIAALIISTSSLNKISGVPALTFNRLLYIAPTS